MGCKASKLENQPLVTICKKRLILIKASSDHRSALAAAHISYFRSLHDVGNALRRFVDDDIFLVADEPNPRKRRQRRRSKKNSRNRVRKVEEEEIHPNHYNLDYHYDNQDCNDNSCNASYMKRVWNPTPSRVYEEAIPIPIYTHFDCNHNNVEFIPPSPKASSTWDYFNPFEMFDGDDYLGCYDSNTSTPDSKEVREREGIPELEEDTESEVYKQSQELYVLEDPPIEVKEMTTCSSSSNCDVSISLSADELYLESSGASLEEMDEAFKCECLEMDGASQCEFESSKVSVLTSLSCHGMRDFREVVCEIKDEFDAASGYGKEVCQLLGPGRLPFRSRGDFLRAILSRMMCLISRSLSTLLPQAEVSISYGGYGAELGNDVDSSSIVSTLDKLYAWEKKLYKEVKDEEKLRIMYEKKCKKLRLLEDRGGEASKIEATQASIREMLVKINVSIRSVDSAARCIHQLRDEELQPQIQKLIFGLRKMWTLMLKCHHKQFQAILQSQTIKLRANTDFQEVSSVRANVTLELELVKWCNRLNEWIELQRRYIKSLNTWLVSCLNHELEETPPVYAMCHDWEQAMERISSVSENDVQVAMNDFAASLHKFSETQMGKSEDMIKGFEDQIRSLRVERAKMMKNDVSLNRGRVLMVGSESSVSEANNDLKVELIQMFEALESFSSEAVKAYDDVRVNAVIM